MVREFLIATYYFLLAMLYYDVCAGSGGTLQPISRPFRGKSEGWPEWYQIPPQTLLQTRKSTRLRFWWQPGKTGKSRVAARLVSSTHGERA